MSDYRDLIPEHIRTLGGYTPGKSHRQAQRESRVTCIKLASNESPFGPSPRAIEAMKEVLGECNLYPDNDASELRRRLAEKHQVEPEQIVVTAGSTSLLGIITRTLLDAGLNAITSRHSFIVYPIATQASGGALIEVPTRNHGFDLDGIAAAINPQTRLIFLANPNNPTSTMVTAEAVDRFMEKVPAHVIVVLDEAYFDFADHFARSRGANYSHALQYVRQNKNIVVLRTFSKAHGLAGVRVGYGIGPRELMSHFARMRTTFSVSAVAQAAALAALEDEAHTQKALANNAEQAEWVAEKLLELGYTVPLPWANFVFCELGEDSAPIAKRLQEEGVIVRPLGPWGAPTAIRVTIGTPEQNRSFLGAFKKVATKAAVR